MPVPSEWLARPPGYELFFAPLFIDLAPGRVEYVRIAYKHSKFGHYKQKREDGSRYFDHPKAAAWIYINELQGRDYLVIVLLLLHDIEEDSDLLSPFVIRKIFGRHTALNVRAVTKVAKVEENTDGVRRFVARETAVEYMLRVIAQGPRAILAKLCDRLHNLRTLGSCSSEKRIRYIAETTDCYLPHLLKGLRSHGKPWSGYADTIEAKINEAIEAHAKP